MISVSYISPRPVSVADNVTFQYDGFGRRVSITEKHGTDTISTKRFVWTGAFIAQERNGAGTTVTKQFFDDGELVGTTKYFYTFDHLGSIREMTDNSGVVHAKYDYDAWGRQTKLSGDFDADFGYTGDYFIEKVSGLYLTCFRAYDSEKGRWLSRDPLGEDEGTNLYSYVYNNPFIWVDPLGLSSCPNPVPGHPGWGYRSDPAHTGGDKPHFHFSYRGKEWKRKIDQDGNQKPHGKGKNPGPDKDIPKDVVKDAIKDYDKMEAKQPKQRWRYDPELGTFVPDSSLFGTFLPGFSIAPGYTTIVPLRVPALNPALCPL